MTEYAIAAHREGDRVAIETLVHDADYEGVANTSYLDAVAAIRFGEAVAAWGRQIMAEPIQGRVSDVVVRNDYIPSTPMTFDKD